MRVKAVLLAALTAGVVAAVGCHHDRYKIVEKRKEECTLPPSEPRFDEPPTEGYRKPPPKKQEKTLVGGSGGKMGGPLNPGP